MRDALIEGGAAAAAAPPPFPPVRDEVPADRRDAVAAAYYEPGTRYEWRPGFEARQIECCRVIVHVATGIVTEVHEMRVTRPPVKAPPTNVAKSVRRGKRGGAGRRGPADYRALFAMLKAEGCKVSLAQGSQHYRIDLPDGTHLQISATPSDSRTLPNEVARLRRRGLKLARF